MKNKLMTTFDSKTSLSINKEVWKKFKSYAQNELNMTASMAIHIMMLSVVKSDKLAEVIETAIDKVIEVREEQRKPKG